MRSLRRHGATGGAGGGAPGRLRRILASLRVRLVSWHVLLLVLGLALSLIAARVVLLVRLDERIERDLSQEVEELRSLAGGVDPDTGEPFGADAQRVLEVFLSRNVPARHEQLLGYVDGEAVFATRPPAGVTVDLGAAFEDRVATLDEPVRDAAEVASAGTVEYHAVPLQVDGDTSAVFVVGWFRDLEAAEIDEVIVVAALVGLILVGLAGAVVSNVAGRTLRPVGEVTATARRITDTDLSERLPADGSDEVSELARTFNAMLDRLESAFAAQRQLIDDAGHELRTPITIVRGHLELLDDGDAHERAQTIELVTEELDRMHRMVEDLLLLAKAGRPDFLHLAPVDLADLTHAVHAKASAIAPRRWVVESAGEAVLVADAQRLTQAAVQLAANAAAHTGEHGTITIGSAADDDAIRLWVADDGPGVPVEERERIFDRFSRGAAHTRVGEGAGLGLSIVRAIAHAHDGHVEVGGQPGEGAVFTLVLPPVSVPSVEPATAPPAGDGAAEAPHADADAAWSRPDAPDGGAAAWAPPAEDRRR